MNGFNFSEVNIHMENDLKMPNFHSLAILDFHYMYTIDIKLSIFHLITPLRF